MRLFFAKFDPETLVERWRSANTWSIQDDWHCPAVEAVAAALAERGEAQAAARELGMQRAGVGVSIRDGLLDLETAYRVASRGEPPLAVARTFSEGWAEAEVEALLGRSSVDVLTGLVTLDYVRARLGEVYAGSDESRRCFVIVDASGRRNSGPARLARSLGLSNLLRSVFSSGETTAVLPGGLFVALTHDCQELEDTISRLTRGAHAFEGGASESVKVWVEPLPSSQEHAEQLLLELDAA